MVATPFVEQVEGIDIEEEEIERNGHRGDHGEIGLRPASAFKPGDRPVKIVPQLGHAAWPHSFGQVGSGRKADPALPDRFHPIVRNATKA